MYKVRWKQVWPARPEINRDYREEEWINTFDDAVKLAKFVLHLDNCRERNTPIQISDIRIEVDHGAADSIQEDPQESGILQETTPGGSKG